MIIALFMLFVKVFRTENAREFASFSRVKYLFLCNLQNYPKIVITRNPIGLGMRAVLTPVRDDIFPTLLDDFHWLHEPATGRRPIARVYINMLGPQAVRAVIGIPIPRHIAAAVPADKVLNLPTKLLRHYA